MSVQFKSLDEDLGTPERLPGPHQRHHPRLDSSADSRPPGRPQKEVASKAVCDTLAWILHMHRYSPFALSEQPGRVAEHHARIGVRADRFGGPANSESPVTLRPHLAMGLPLSSVQLLDAPIQRGLYDYLSRV